MKGLKAVCSRFPDKRRGKNRVYSIADIGLSGFAPFFMQCESFLSYQKQLEEGLGTSNCQTLFGMEKIPSDNHIRMMMLDPVHPSYLQKSFVAEFSIVLIPQIQNNTPPIHGIDVYIPPCNKHFPPSCTPIAS